MTELEYEKAARGPDQGTSDAYAWGTTDIADAAYGLSNDDGTASASATVTTNYGNGIGNVSYSNTDGGLNGPLRVGTFTTASSTRAEAGADYYGMMELSGNLWEHLVNVTVTEFDFEKGDGDITPLPASWLPASVAKAFVAALGAMGPRTCVQRPASALCGRGRVRLAAAMSASALAGNSFTLYPFYGELFLG